MSDKFTGYFNGGGETTVATTYGYDAEGERTTSARTIPLATGTATQVTTTSRDVVANALLHGTNLGVSRRQTQTLAIFKHF